MISQFIRETIRDTNRAVRNITDIINAEFPPNSQSQNSTGNSTSVSGATRLTLPQVNDILGRNYRSLVRLFNTEFRSALVKHTTLQTRDQGCCQTLLCRRSVLDDDHS
uniref:Uncharacterized protein n=1 Tax=Rhodnius prolixus TaxID=13249 RepID=T1I8G1_RHOPR